MMAVVRRERSRVVTWLTSWGLREVSGGAGLQQRGGQSSGEGLGARGEGWRQELRDVLEAKVVAGAPGDHRQRERS